MKAAVIRDSVDGYVDIKDVTLRPIKHGEALVDVEYCAFATLIYTLQLVTSASSLAGSLVTKVLGSFHKLPMTLKT